MNRILGLQFYLVSSSSAAPWHRPLPLQLRDPNYGNGDINTFSKKMFEQFTEYLTGWQIRQVLLSSEGSKLFSFRGHSPLTALTRGSAPGSAPRPPLQPPTANPLASPLIRGLKNQYFSNTKLLSPRQRGFMKWRSVCPSVCLSVCLSVCVSVYSSVRLSLRQLSGRGGVADA